MILYYPKTANTSKNNSKGIKYKEINFLGSIGEICLKF